MIIDIGNFCQIRINVARPNVYDCHTVCNSPGNSVVPRFGSFLSPQMSRSQRPNSSMSTSPTLDSIVVQYLRNQHEKCSHPVSVCPPFSLLKYGYNRNTSFRKHLLIFSMFVFQATSMSTTKKTLPCVSEHYYKTGS